jgi:hypothetical protein
VTRYVTPQEAYDVKARRISGSHAEKLEQIDAAIQELLDIKTLECLATRPNVQFLAVPRPRPHAFAMTVTILAMLIVLILLLGASASHAQTTDPPAPIPAAQAHPLWATLDLAYGGGTRTQQHTALVGPMWRIGNKTGAW